MLSAAVTEQQLKMASILTYCLPIAGNNFNKLLSGVGMHDVELSLLSKHVITCQGLAVHIRLSPGGWQLGLLN